MNPVTICIALALILAPFSFLGQAASQPTQSEIDSANLLFEAGKFAQAGELYSRIVAQNTKDYSATLQLGRIALLSNRLDDAQKWLTKAIALQPGDADPRIMLAELYYRRDDFSKAAVSLNGVEVSNSKLIASQYPLNVPKLESFKGLAPYEVHGSGESTRLKFVKIDPLPMVRVRVNGSDEVTFFIDTGGSEVALDGAFARELGVPQFGAVQGTFAGGQHANVQNGRIESLTVGDWTIRNLPVFVTSLRQLSEPFGVKRLDGVIGTNLLYHFLATIDYSHGELVLRRKTAKNLKQFEAASSGKRVAVPFWIAGDHFMVGWGRVETIPPALLFVDTGTAGSGVALAESVIKEAGIKLEKDTAWEGEGGGGKVKFVPYTVRQLSFGDIREKNVPGIYAVSGPFPWEKTFGFHLAGMVGHDFFKSYAVTFDFENMQIFLQH